MYVKESDSYVYTIFSKMLFLNVSKKHSEQNDNTAYLKNVLEHSWCESRAFEITSDLFH